MKKSVGFVCLMFILTILLSSHNLAIKTDSQSGNDIKVDENYLFAINTANKFLIAWLNRDYKNGTELLTEKVKSSVNLEDLNMFFTEVSNPHHQGFEIVGKEYVDENTLVFSVWLYEHYTGETPLLAKRPSPYILEVVKANENNWLVNNLPK